MHCPEHWLDQGEGAALGPRGPMNKAPPAHLAALVAQGPQQRQK